MIIKTIRNREVMKHHRFVEALKVRPDRRELKMSPKKPRFRFKVCSDSLLDCPRLL